MEVIYMTRKKETPENQPARHLAKADDLDIDIQSCSTTDCTGLIPSLPQTDAEIEHYNELYPFLPGRADKPAPKNRSADLY